MKRSVTLKISSLVAWGIILVLTQLLISQWTVRVAGSREVIDYVSFAGTVVGMILAVLAIIYAFLSTSSQKDDAENLRSQLANLNDTISRADVSEEKFKLEVGKLEEILGGLTDLQKIALQSAARVDQRFDQLQARESRATKKVKDEAIVAEGPAVIDYKPALVRLAAMAAPWQVLVYHALWANPKDAVARKDELDRLLLETVSERLLSEYLDGQASGFYWCLSDLKLFEDQEAMDQFVARLRVSAIRLIAGLKDNSMGASGFDKDALIGELEKVQA